MKKKKNRCYQFYQLLVQLSKIAINRVNFFDSTWEIITIFRLDVLLVCCSKTTYKFAGKINVILPDIFLTLYARNDQKLPQFLNYHYSCNNYVFFLYIWYVPLIILRFENRAFYIYNTFWKYEGNKLPVINDICTKKKL